LHACDALAVEPAHALYIGDSVNDAMAAQAAGMLMVCVNHGYRTDHAVSDLPCLQVIDDLSELLELIGGPTPWRRPKRSTHLVRRCDEQVGQWIWAEARGVRGSDTAAPHPSHVALDNVICDG